MANVALVAIAGKPIHAGHWALIELASSENHEVKLFVSTCDRIRPKQFPISGAAMLTVWQRYLEKHLPANIEVTYVHNPTSAVWDLLVSAERNCSRDTYIVYGDDTDVNRNYPTSSIVKHAPTLDIELRPVSRMETVDVSGTQMREWLASGDKEEFIQNLPAVARDDGYEIWDALSRHM